MYVHVYICTKAQRLWSVFNILKNLKHTTYSKINDHAKEKKCKYTDTIKQLHASALLQIFISVLTSSQLSTNLTFMQTRDSVHLMSSYFVFALIILPLGLKFNFSPPLLYVIIFFLFYLMKCYKKNSCDWKLLELKEDCKLNAQMWARVKMYRASSCLKYRSILPSIELCYLVKSRNLLLCLFSCAYY